MNKTQTFLIMMLCAFGSASAQQAAPVDTTIANVNVEAAGLVIIRNLVEGAIVVTDDGAVYADVDTNCTGYYITQGEYLTLAFPCFPYPEQFEYRYSTWDKNHDKFDVYRCIGMPKIKLYMVDPTTLSR